jgi:hypothetical protein
MVQMRVRMYAKVINLLFFMSLKLLKNHTIFNGLGAKVMVFNATFNNISVISWRSV